MVVMLDGVIGDLEIVMGSSQKYWQYARDCAKWAGQTKQEDDRDILERMSKAWVHLALVDEDVVRQTRYEPKGRLHS
jgi:hypothetical protein